MSYVENSNQLWNTLSAIAEDEGLCLYDLEKTGSRLLKVVIDKQVAKDQQLGESSAVERVTSKDCTRMCKRVMVFCAAEGSEYGLIEETQIDVSSPGINRELRIPEHFSAAIGERVKVVSQSGKSQSGEAVPAAVIGVLERMDGDVLSVRDEQDQNEYQIPLNCIKRANVEFKFED